MISCLAPCSLFIWCDENGRQTKYMPHGTFEYETSDHRLIRDPYLVPCGQCLMCKKAKAGEWSNRLVCEAKYHKEISFLTLTYDQEHVPRSFDSQGRQHLTLKKTDLQLFIKNLRRHLEYRHMPKIRFYAVGEYGSKTYRPHYHAIIFGYFPSDAKLVKYNKQGQHLYHSVSLASIWDKGEVMIGRASPQTMFYTAAYVTGKQLGVKGKKFYAAMNIEKPFSTMSRKPGIGKQYALDHKDDILKGQTLSVAIDGNLSTFTAPRYFLSQFELTDPEKYANLKEDRLDSLEVATADYHMDWFNPQNRKMRGDRDTYLAYEKYGKKRIGI